MLSSWLFFSFVSEFLFAGLYVSTRGWVPHRLATGQILFNGDPLQQFEARLCPIARQTNGG